MGCILMFILFVSIRCSQSQDSEEDINVLLDRFIDQTKTSNFNTESNKEDRKKLENSRIFYLKSSPEIVTKVKNEIFKKMSPLDVDDEFLTDSMFGTVDAINNNSNDIDIIGRTSDLTAPIDQSSESFFTSTEIEQNNNMKRFNSNNDETDDDVEISHRSAYPDHENNLFHQYPEIIIDKITKIDEPKQYPEVTIDKITKITNEYPMLYPEVVLDKVTKIDQPNPQSEKAFKGNKFNSNPQDNDAYSNKVQEEIQQKKLQDALNDKMLDQKLQDLPYFEKIRHEMHHDVDLSNKMHFRNGLQSKDYSDALLNEFQNNMRHEMHHDDDPSDKVQFRNALENKGYYNDALLNELRHKKHHGSHQTDVKSYDLKFEPYYDDLKDPIKYYEVPDYDIYPVDDDDIGFRMYSPTSSSNYRPPVFDNNPIMVGPPMGPLMRPPREPPIPIGGPVSVPPCVNPNYPYPCLAAMNEEVSQMNTVPSIHGDFNTHFVPPVVTYRSPNFLLNQNPAAQNPLSKLTHFHYLPPSFNNAIPRIIYR